MTDGSGRTLDSQAVSVVLPAFNEGEIIMVVLSEVATVLHSAGLTFELLVVDDGSTDGTGEIVAGLAKSTPQVQILTHARNLGYGAAIRTGLEVARFPVTVIMDTDGQYLASDLLPALAALQGVAGVIGVRAHRADSLYRLSLAKFGRLLGQSVFPTGVVDVNCGLKVFRTQLLQSAPLRSSGGFISTEIVRRLNDAGGGIRQLTVGHLQRLTGRASGGSLRVVCRTLFDGWLELRTSRQRQPYTNSQHSGDQ